MTDRMLAFFTERQNEFVSGQLLSSYFKCSRTAVWKHIQRLKRQGYVFVAAPRLGYKLVAKPERLEVSALMRELKTRTLGRKLIVVEETASTQTLAQQQAALGAPEGTLIIAEKQTSGKGRMGRSWHSPAGKGIYMSLLLMPEIPLAFASQLTPLVSVALCRSIRKLCGVEIGIKWPNDLLIAGKKVCGILLESRAEDERLLVVVAGVGISANLTAADFPPELKERATSLLLAAGAPVDRAKLIACFLEELEQLYTLYKEKGFAPIRTLWEALSLTLNKQVSVRAGSGIVEGLAEAVDALGGLIVRGKDGTRTTLYTGEVGYESVPTK